MRTHSSDPWRMELDTSVESAADRQPSEVGAKQLLTLHCEQCNSVLGDSLGVCGQSAEHIMCVKVTNNVIISDEMKLELEGETTQCICSSLTCSGCVSALGRVVHAAPRHLEMLRSAFLLSRAKVKCYVLDSGGTVRSSDVTFDLKPLGGAMDEMTRQVRGHLGRMSRITTRWSRKDPCR